MPLLTAEDYTRFAPVEPHFRYVYGADSQQFAELTLPRRPGPHSVIVLVHGGGYRDVYDLRPLGGVVEALANEGFAVWNIEYRRAGNGGDFPNMFLDVGAATDHLQEIAAERELDLKGVITVGHSAGGHLALWLAGRKQIAESSAVYRAEPLPIAGVIGLAPLADIADALENDTGGSPLLTVLGGSLPRAQANLPAVSPAELLPLGVPQIHIVGSEDKVMRANLRRYVTASLDAGDEIELVEIADAGHFEIVAVDAPEWQYVIQAVRRLRGAVAVALR